MTRLSVYLVVGLFPAGVLAQRIGAPVSVYDTTPTVSVATDAGELAPATPVGEPIFDVSLPQLLYDPGQPVVLSTHLHMRDGTDVDGAEVTVADDDHGKARGKALGHGRHSVALDGSPGDHFVTVHSSSLDRHGNRVNRGVNYSYTVSTGHVKFLDVGRPQSRGEQFVVPLRLVATAPVYAMISGVLASGQTAVAEAQADTDLKPGEATVELRFNYSDLVESGPYRLIKVMAFEPDNTQGKVLAAAPVAVGKPFAGLRAGTGIEPEGQTESVRGPAPPVLLDE